MRTPDPQAVLDYWLDPTKTIGQRVQHWFAGTPEIDAEIRARFEPWVEAAERGELKPWEDDPWTCLALLILIDQFSLNIYRDQPRSFRNTDLGLPIALRALEKGFDQKVEPLDRLFYYLPLEHAENLEIQNRSVALFEKLLVQAAPEQRSFMESFLDYALKHREVIQRFGRYPDRNPILGRQHTPDEAAYMAAGGPPF